MTDLLRALSEAERGSRELDAAIARMEGWREVEVSAEDGSGKPVDWSGLPPNETRPRAWARVPAYTTSLDIAKTLVPADCIWHLYVNEDGTADAGILGGGDIRSTVNIAPTDALALCIAALEARARAAGQDGAG